VSLVTEGEAMRVLERDEWVDENFAGCELGHVKRTRRLMVMAGKMLECPELSLPKQNVEWSDVKAAYRLCDREEVTFDAVAECHWQRVRQTSPGVHLLISDTTDINEYTHRATTGLGMLGDGQGRGLQLHSCLVVEASTGVVEGLAAAKVFYRQKSPKKETRAQRLNRPRESSLWGDVVDQAGSPPAGSQWVHVFDRGGDNFESLCHIVAQQCDWVIRASKLKRKVLLDSGESVPLDQAIQTATLLGSYQLSLRSRPGQAARVATLNVRTVRVSFPAPATKSRYVKACGIQQIPMNVVIVEEVNASKGVTPIRWVLLTSLPVETLDQAWTVIGYYELRWTIEEYHKVLKTGCGVEQHALRTAARLEPLIALISVVGVRLLQLKTISKHDPDTKARHRVPKLWLQALKLKRPKLAPRDLTVYEFFRELAKLGGFLGRTHDGEPGWQTLWLGHQRLQALIQGIQLANSKT
jgi:Transposase DNA-binding/Transposase Tn5 dimerisation domain